MGEWPVQCFKAYDIRGLANGDGSGELTPQFAYDWVVQWQSILVASGLLSDVTFAILHQL